MPFIFALPGIVMGFLRRLTWQQLLAGAVVVGGWLLWVLGKRAGRKGEAAEQAAADMEFGEDIRDRAHEAKEQARKDTSGMSHDDIAERLRAKGRLRD